MNDAETPPSNLTVTATSSNTAVVANSDISIGGTGASRTVSVLPTAVGLSNIVVSVSDGTVYTTFTINYAVSAESTFPGTTRFHAGSSDGSTANRMVVKM